MSVKNLKKILATTNNTQLTSVDIWVRPTDWLPLPSIVEQQRFVGLLRIDPTGNLIGLTAAGNYTVDWGDGTQTNHNSGTNAYKEYDYTTISNTGEATLGYRQVIVQIYPQSGQNLTSVYINTRHNQSGLPSVYSPGWLDVAINSPNLTIFSCGSSSGTVSQRGLQQITILSHNLSSMYAFFMGCPALVSVPLFNTSNITVTQSMFQGCQRLRSIPCFNTSKVNTMANMFNGCSALTTIPLLDSSSVTLMNGMFGTCSLLESVPLLDTSKVTNMGSMFFNCISLKTVPLFNTSSATNMSSMFNGCTMLQTIPLFNTSSVTLMQNMFQSCGCLLSIPILDTSKVTNMSSMFYGTASMKEYPSLNTASCTDMNYMFYAARTPTVPLFNTALVSNMSNMFLSCGLLTNIPAFNTSSLTNAQSMFSNCSNLVAIPALNVSGVTSGNFLSFANNCGQVSSVGITNINQTISFASCKLSASQINNIFTNLSSTGTGKTITVTGNYGAASCDTTIATAKGWTVAT